MMAALQLKEFQAVWFDKRKNVQTIRPGAALGFILNLPSGSKIAGWLPPSIFARKHWIAIRKIGDDLYFNLDSHLSEPEVIGAETDLLAFLATELAQEDRELLIIVDNNTANTDLYTSLP